MINTTRIAVVLSNPSYAAGHLQSWVLRSIGLLAISLLTACGTPAGPATTPPPTALIASPTGVASSPTPVAFPPTYDAVAFAVTVGVVEQTMITATPIHGLSPEKAAREQQRDTDRRAEATTVVLLHITPVLQYPEPTLPPRTPLPGPPKRAAGAGLIVEDNRCGLDKHQLGSKNHWRETNGPLMTAVCAGTTYFMPYKAQLLVEVDNLDTRRIAEGPDMYDVPAPVLWVRVIDAVGERLILQADTGAQFAFDVPTRQWVTLDGTPLPTLSPSPDQSPLPLPSPSAGPPGTP